jgi:hypothetical protein
MCDFCPKKIVRAARISGGFKPYEIKLNPGPETANLSKIVCNSVIPILLRLLLCGKCKKRLNISCCQYPGHKNRATGVIKCCCSKTDIASLYIAQNRSKNEHYLIVFVEGMRSGRKDDLVKILNDTMILLNINNARVHFYIFYYGPPVITNELNSVQKYVNKIFAPLLMAYRPNEDICTARQIGRKEDSLTISGDRYLKCCTSNPVEGTPLFE